MEQSQKRDRNGQVAIENGQEASRLDSKGLLLPDGRCYPYRLCRMKPVKRESTS